ncbi:MAG: hypothetical protein JW778_06900 [Candidatus Altiarchaeota archaeon]|nr:hypothetical protein [Candidatus Altiarchaeota archaeon]
MDASDLRKKIEDFIGWLRYFTEIGLDEITDRLREGPLRIMAIGAVVIVFLITILLLSPSNQETKPEDKPVTMTEEQAIQIAQKEYLYATVNSTYLSGGIWFVAMDLPLPITVPNSDNTTKSVWVCVNTISGNNLILSSEGRFIRGEL